MGFPLVKLSLGTGEASPICGRPYKQNRPLPGKEILLRSVSSGLGLQPASLPARFQTCLPPQQHEPIPENTSMSVLSACSPVYLLLALSLQRLGWDSVLATEQNVPGCALTSRGTADGHPEQRVISPHQDAALAWRETDA